MVCRKTRFVFDSIMQPIIISKLSLSKRVWEETDISYRVSGSDGNNWAEHETIWCERRSTKLIFALDIQLGWFLWVTRTFPHTTGSALRSQWQRQVRTGSQKLSPLYSRLRLIGKVREWPIWFIYPDFPISGIGFGAMRIWGNKDL